MHLADNTLCQSIGTLHRPKAMYHADQLQQDDTDNPRCTIYQAAVIFENFVTARARGPTRKDVVLSRDNVLVEHLLHWANALKRKLSLQMTASETP